MAYSAPGWGLLLPRFAFEALLSEKLEDKVLDAELFKLRRKHEAEDDLVSRLQLFEHIARYIRRQQEYVSGDIRQLISKEQDTRSFLCQKSRHLVTGADGACVYGDY